MKTLFTLVSFFLASAPLAAQTPIERSFDLDANALVEIGNLAGSVVVRGWDHHQVRITGTLGRDVEELKVEGDARRLKIEVAYPHESRRRVGRANESALVVELPRVVELTVATASASIEVEGISGHSMRLRSVSGAIQADSGSDELQVGTVSGLVRASGSQRRLSIETVSGHAEIKGTANEVALRSVSGRIDFKAESVEQLNVGTVSGDITLDIGALHPRARIEAETMSGNVGLVLSAAPSARVEASSFSGSIRSDFGSVERLAHGPGQSLGVDLGEASARIKLTTFSGAVRIQRH